MNKSLEIFNRAVKESKGTNLIELANSEIQAIKESLERLEKLEKVVKILKGTSIIVVDKNFMTINTNAIWRNDNSGCYDVLKEVFGE